MAWESGEVIVRREVLNDGRTWVGGTVRVVEDTDAHLVTYLPTGTPFSFPDGDWPTDDGLHPWNHGGKRWFGHGTLMVQRPGDSHAVWHFWDGDDRTFRCWYLNLQEPFRRTPIGYDTQDLELDLVVFPDGSWVLKDEELLDVRVRDGRFSQQQADGIRRLGDELAAELDAGRHWWNPRWVDWRPDPAWEPVPVPAGWDEVPT